MPEREPKVPEPGPPPPPPDATEKKATTEPDLPGWYRDEYARIKGSFEKADTMAEATLGRQKEQLGELKGRILSSPAAPKAPELPPVPAQKPMTAKPFLEGGPGESWQNSLQKIMMGFGLMGQMAVGLKGGFPNGALAAYSGALEGWQQGDKDRAAREWTNYLDEVQRNEKESRRIRQAFDDKTAEWGHDQERLKTELTLLGAEHGLDGQFLDMARQQPERALKLLDQQTNMWRQMKNDAASLTMKNLMFLQTERAHEDLKKYREDMLKLKRDESGVGEFGGEGGKTGGFSPEALEMAARTYVDTGTLPPMGMGKAGTAARKAIMNRAAEIAGTTSGGIEGQSERSATYKGSQTEINSIQRQRGPVLAFARNFDRAADLALEMSEKTDRTGTPIFNKWLLAGKQATGDVDVARFHAAVLTASTEYARVMSGGTVSTDTARAEAGKILSGIQTPEQFRGVVDIMKRDTENRIKGYDDQLKAVQEEMRQQRGAGGKKPTETGPRVIVGPDKKEYNLAPGYDVPEGYKLK